MGFPLYTFLGSLLMFGCLRNRNNLENVRWYVTVLNARSFQTQWEELWTRKLIFPLSTWIFLYAFFLLLNTEIYNGHMCWYYCKMWGMGIISFFTLRSDLGTEQKIWGKNNMYDHWEIYSLFIWLDVCYLIFRKWCRNSVV